MPILHKLDRRQPAFPDYQYRISFEFEEHFANWLKFMTDNFGQTTPLFLRKYAPDGWNNDVWSWESNILRSSVRQMHIFLKDDKTLGLLRFKFPDL